MIRLFRFLKPYRWYIAIVLVFAALQSFANLYLPNLNADIINNGIVKNDTGYILRQGGLMLLITLGGALSAVVTAYFALEDRRRLRAHHPPSSSRTSSSSRCTSSIPSARPR